MKYRLVLAVALVAVLARGGGVVRAEDVPAPVAAAADGAAVVSGTLPRGATGTVCGSPSGSGEVGAGR